MERIWFLIPIVILVGWLSAESPPRPSPSANNAGNFEEVAAPPADITALVRRACYDCHSNETRWPWYSRIPPASWIVRRDVTNGRKVLNFSEWGRTHGQTPASSAAMLMAACANVKGGRMPKPSYLLLHPEARLREAEINRFCEWTNSQQQKTEAPPSGD